MKIRCILNIALVALLLCSCQARRKIELNQFESFFVSRDTNTLNFILFSGRDSNIAAYANNLYEKYSSFDSLATKSGINHPVVAVYKYATTFTKVDNHEYGFSNPEYNSSFSIKFTEDSLIFNNSEYGIPKSYSIPSQVEVGDTFLDGKISFIKEDELYLNKTKYHCVVVRWTSSWVDSFGQRSFSFDFWIDPDKFIIKAEMIDSNNNRDIYFPDKDTSLSSFE